MCVLMAVMKYWSSVHCGHCVTAVFPTSLLPQPSQMTQLSSAGPATAMLSKVSPAGGKRRCPLRSSSTPSRSAQMKWFNKLLNGRQKAAVVRVMEGQCRPMPYVIFGPPGYTHCTAFVTWLIYIASLWCIVCNVLPGLLQLTALQCSMKILRVQRSVTCWC